MLRAGKARILCRVKQESQIYLELFTQASHNVINYAMRKLSVPRNKSIAYAAVVWRDDRYSPCAGTDFFCKIPVSNCFGLWTMPSLLQPLIICKWLGVAVLHDSLVYKSGWLVRQFADLWFSLFRN